MANLFDDANAPETEPAIIVAGDQVKWKRTDVSTDYPNTSYSLRYSSRLEGTGSTTFDVTSADSDDDYLMTIAHGTTASLSTGVYHWQLYIVRDSDSARLTFDAGTWEVKPNLDADTADPRTHAKITLDAVEAVIEACCEGICAQPDTFSSARSWRSLLLEQEKVPNDLGTMHKLIQNVPLKRKYVGVVQA